MSGKNKTSKIGDQITKGKYSNTKGRPSTTQSRKFGPQPKSIVSQLLSKMRAENTITLPINPSEITVPESSINADKTESSDEFEEDTIILHNDKSKEAKDPKNCQTPKIYYCDFVGCSYTSKLSSNITKHKRIHTSEKPYLCESCSFRTNFVNSLKVHRRLHTEERPYRCSECAYKCNSVSNLKKHCHTRHKNSS